MSMLSDSEIRDLFNRLVVLWHNKPASERNDTHMTSISTEEALFLSVAICNFTGDCPLEDIHHIMDVVKEKINERNPS